MIDNPLALGCPPVRGDKPRAFASGLSTVQAGKPCSILSVYLVCYGVSHLASGLSTVQAGKSCSILSVDLVCYGVSHLVSGLLTEQAGNHALLSV